MAKVTIDGKEWEFEEGMNLFEACEIARGGDKLPHFCYHPGLSIAGVCRMCQVEVEGVPKLLIACNSKVQDGMVVHTRNERVDSTVRQILNFHLLHHPVDCPVCDQAGECSLQDFYMDHGLYDAEIDVEDKIAKGKVKPIGELVMLDAERCVLCARCTRFTDEITKTHELGIFNRGNHSEIDVAPGKTLDNNYSLNTADICPVGALTSRDFRFRRRVWWLEETEGICPGCATGCNMTLHHSEGIAYRMKPRENREVNDWWMCDHGRLLYKEIASEDRLHAPLVRPEDATVSVPATWDAAYAAFAARVEALGGAAKIHLVLSPHATLEEQYAAASILAEASGAQVLGARLAGTEMDEADGILLSADRTPNAEGARRLGLADFTVEALAAKADAGNALVVVGNDLAGLSPEAGKAMQDFGLVVYVGDRADATARAAHITLAGRSWAEKDGTFVNKDGRAQALHAAVPAPEGSRDDLRILSELGAVLGHEPSWSDAASVRSEMAARNRAFAALTGDPDPLGRSLDGAEAAEVDGG